MTAVRFPVGGNFSLFHNIQTATEAHPASYLTGTGLLPGAKVAGGEDDHSPPFGAKVKNDDAIPPPPLCRHDISLNYIIKNRDNFVFVHDIEHI